MMTLQELETAFLVLLARVDAMDAAIAGSARLKELFAEPAQRAASGAGLKAADDARAQQDYLDRLARQG